MANNICNFELSRIPDIHFGSGKIKELPEIIFGISSNVLIVVSNSFKNSGYYKKLINELENKKIDYHIFSSSGEPSPELIDSAVLEFGDEKIGAVVGIGGGSVVDSGKAISAMLPLKDSVVNYLEGVGTKNHSGAKIPYIAVPTTSGTGSEATKNAVISRIGEKGFKKSLRHNNFVPDHALVDPVLSLSCSKESTSACGLDALTQLLESYTSTISSPMTDALALSGLEKIRNGFEESCFNGSKNITARENMSYAALMSGITLANAGLGVVHGFASPIGGFFDIPHGVVCGTLLGEATKVNIEVLFENVEKNMWVIKKYSKAGEVLSGRNAKSVDDGCRYLLEIIDLWIKETDIKRLGEYGITKNDIDKIVNKTGYKYNPAQLNKNHLESILAARL